MNDENKEEKVDPILAELDAMTNILDESTIVDESDFEESSDDKSNDDDNGKDDDEGGEEKDEETKEAEEDSKEDLEEKDEDEEESSEETEEETKKETSEQTSERYKLENEELRKRVDELSAPEETKTEEEPKEKELKIDDVDFIGDLDLDEIARDPAEFNKLLNKVYSQGIKTSQEGVLRGIPTIVSNNVKTVIALQEASRKFYEDNADLEPFKKVVASVFEELASEHSNWKYDKILEESGTEARKRLELHKRAIQDNSEEDNKDGTKPKKQLPRKRGQKRGTQTKPDTDPLLNEIEEMNAVVN